MQWAAAWRRLHSYLHQCLEAAGENIQQLAFEGIPGPDDDIFLGAEELR
jgi:hypothetical protein